MAVPLEEIMNRMPKERREKVIKRSHEFVEQYKSLQEFRKAVGWTQDDLAEKLEISQANISKIEGRGDIRLSTLKKYVEAMGYRLEINISSASGHYAQVNDIPN